MTSPSGETGKRTRLKSGPPAGSTPASGTRGHDASGQLQLDLPAIPPCPGEDDPKGLRHWLFAGFVTALERAAEIAAPTTRPDSMHVPPGMGPLVDYYIASSRQMGLVEAARAAQAAMRTREEALIRERENSRLSPPAEAELECARHHEACTICLRREVLAARQAREMTSLEAARRAYLSGLHGIIDALRVSPGAPGLVAAISKELQRIIDRADAKWRKP